jgi:DNA invertase Pin-like site-specific DNA recombinase
MTLYLWHKFEGKGHFMIIGYGRNKSPVREGDTLVVTKIDRLARSVRHLCEIVDRLQAKGIALRLLNLNLDTNDATGKLMLQIIGSIAEFERSIMLARQLEGIAKARRKANIAVVEVLP